MVSPAGVPLQTAVFSLSLRDRRHSLRSHHGGGLRSGKELKYLAGCLARFRGSAHASREHDMGLYLRRERAGELAALAVKGCARNVSATAVAAIERD